MPSSFLELSGRDLASALQGLLEDSFNSPTGAISNPQQNPQGDFLSLLMDNAFGRQMPAAAETSGLLGQAFGGGRSSLQESLYDPMRRFQATESAFKAEAKAKAEKAATGKKAATPQATTPQAGAVPQAAVAPPAPSTANPGTPDPWEAIGSTTQYRGAVELAASETGVPANVIHALMLVEGSGERSVSPTDNLGLMQVGRGWFSPGDDPFDTLTNVRRGAQVAQQKLQNARMDKPEATWDDAAARYFGGTLEQPLADISGVNSVEYVRRFQAALALLDQAYPENRGVSSY